MPKTKKIPLRKCTGCQEMKSKRELIRVVKAEDGTFLVDATGKKAGRGAYICPNITCFQKAKKSRGFDRSFKTAVPKEVYECLEKEIDNIGE